MIMKNIFLGSLAWVASVTVMAQDCTSFFPAKEGNQIELTHYDGKDKLTGHSLTTIKSTRDEGGTYFWNQHMESFNDKGKLDFETDAEMSCSGGEFHLDMKNMVPQQQMQGMEGMEMSIEGGDMTFPSVLSVGQTLPDAYISIKAGSGGMTIMNMEVHITNRKVEGKESVTTPAGTFDCYKMSQDISTKMMFSIKAHSIDWYAPGAGLVKQESYDDKGRLTGKEILTKLVK
jgi:hypothetical protein